MSRALNDYKYHNNNTPICPWCDFAIEDLFECGASDKDGETRELQCENCEKYFEAETHVSWSFTTKATRCKKHILITITDFENVKQYSCSECKNCYYDWQLPGGQYPKLKEGDYEFYDSKKHNESGEM